MPENENTTDETRTTEEQPPAPDAEGTTDSGGESDLDGAENLGDAGKRALDSMKGKWKDERTKRQTLEQRIAELESAPKGETETPDAEQIKAQATREAVTKANARIVRAEIKAAAAGKFADPADAFAFLDPAKFEVSEDGEVDADEISDAIEELLTRKPHLAATAKRRFQGTGDGGASRKAATGPTQLTRDALDKMSPAEIVKAKAEGRLANLFAGK
jgi:hypothetical protein